MTLPAFLLTYADSNCVWMGLKKYGLPAVNARWSLARTAVLTLAQTLFGLAVALVLSLLIFRQPVGWIFWFAGLMSFCQGIVCYGLTGLCWNQRVAKLKENPNLPLQLPPSRYVVFRWMLGLIYFVVLAVITPLAMVVTVQNVYGQMLWRRTQAELAAQGERLTFRELLGPEIPAAENAGAASFFAPFFDYPHGNPLGAQSNDPFRPASSNAIARIMDRLNLPAAHLPNKPKDALTTPKENLAEWSAAYRKLVAMPGRSDPSWAAGLKLPPPGNPARDVLAGLSVADEVIAEVCAAAARPRSQFPLHWDEGCLALLKHLAFLKSVQQNLNLRCAAHLEAGEVDAAFIDATNALNVAELLREEPLLISQLVRIAQGAIAVRTLWQGLAEHRWTDAQLAVLQERMKRMDYMAGLVLGLEGERVSGTQIVEAFVAGPSKSGMVESDAGLRRAAMLVPLGVLRENQVDLVRRHTALLANLKAHIANAGRDGLARPAQMQALKDKQAKEGGKQGTGVLATLRASAEQPEPFSPFTLLARMMMPALSKAELRAARAQTTIQLAITACALERYRLAHGDYPETLDALTPAFLPKPLPDLMTGQPYHYGRTDDGWFHLYSVGEDGKDDGGVFRAKPKDAIKDWPWPVPTRAQGGSLF